MNENQAGRAGKDWFQVGAASHEFCNAHVQLWSTGLRSQQSVSCLCMFGLYVGNCVLANTIKKHFLRSGLLNKGQRFALKALVLLSSLYSRLVDILCKAEISVSRRKRIYECAGKIDNKNCA